MTFKVIFNDVKKNTLKISQNLLLLLKWRFVINF